MSLKLNIHTPILPTESNSSSQRNSLPSPDSLIPHLFNGLLSSSTSSANSLIPSSPETPKTLQIYELCNRYINKYQEKVQKLKQEVLNLRNALSESNKALKNSKSKFQIMQDSIENLRSERNFYKNKVTFYESNEAKSPHSKISNKTNSEKPKPVVEKEKENENKKNVKVFKCVQKREKFKDLYEILYTELLGEGNYSKVYKCRRIEDNKIMAVKIVEKSNLNEHELGCLRNEIAIMSQIKHKNIVSMEKAFENSKKIKIIMEYCEGGDLFDRIKNAPKHRLNEKESAQIIAILSQTVQFLHSNGIVHRDLKPENILFTASGDLKIMDFGLSHIGNQNDHKMSSSCGTPSYCAPEVLSGQIYNESCDLWSLGVILFIMLNGYHPFNSHSIPETYKKIMSGDFIQTYRWDKLDHNAKKCVLGLMSVNSKLRWTFENLFYNSWIQRNITFSNKCC